MYEVNKIVNEMNKVVDKVSKACDICLGRKKVLEDMKASHQDRWLTCILTGMQRTCLDQTSKGGWEGRLAGPI